MSSPEDTAPTIWSEMLFDTLYQQLEDGKSDAVLVKTMKELNKKELPPSFVIRKVRAKLGDKSADRLKELVSGASSAKGKKPRRGGGTSRPVQKVKRSGGFMQSIRTFFS